ncbi:adenine nucleotide alpha hydrolase family protein [Candidatus Micrarchaeota archaeon]|nr:adenine nucleotide alpha hydrolase family protein [Candidatus Micrarchaeota archaeon]
MSRKGNSHSYFSVQDIDNHILKRAEKVMKHVRGRMIVAVSGGKDSLVSSIMLKRLDIEHELFHINLGIPVFSDESLSVVSEFAEQYRLKLNVVNIEDYAKKTIPEYVPFAKKMYHKDKPCALCGLFKRYIMNKWAWEHNFDYIITGHNLDDAASTIIMNIMGQNIDQLFRVAPVIERKENVKMVGKVKPLYWVREDLIKQYVSKNNIRTVQATCPYAASVHQNRIKDALRTFEKTEHNFMVNLVKTIKKIQKIKNISISKNVEVLPCERCGFATTSKVCKFCRIIEKVD